MSGRKSVLELEVATIADIKAGLTAWNAVLTHFQEAEGLPKGLTKLHVVPVTLDDRRGLEKMVVLQFIAPRSCWIDCWKC